MKQKRYLRAEGEGKNCLFMLSLGVVLLFFLILTRLWYLQVIESEKLQNLSESNRLRFVPIAASRGTIIDRNGKVIVNNMPSFSVAAVPQEVRDKEGFVENLSRYLNIEREELLKKWEKGKGRARYFPIILASGLGRDEVELLEENRLRLPGMDIEMKPVREYIHGRLAAHLLGYLGEITEDEIADERYKRYNPGDYIGKSGIERQWESDLHGYDGGRQIEVDARGRYLRTLNETKPTIGNSIMLTIDTEVQKAAEDAFEDKAGAAVVMEVATGEILAFASNPTFDPADFTSRMSPEQWKKYVEDKRHPLENKALKGQYPPGSTFKIVTALAGLQEGLVDEKTTVTCTGSYKFGKSTFRCWEKRGHGQVNLKRALKESCDVYFYQLGEKLGVDKIAEYARKFRLGERVGIGLDNEKPGVIPTAEWKLKKFGERWFRGETLPVSIGQGYVLMTPVQLAAMIAAVANDGVMYRPHLVKKIIDPDGKVLREFKPELVGQADIPRPFFASVKEGLVAVVNEPKGTGGAARLYEVRVAGKTGTSQVVKLRDNKGGIPYQYRDHALFVAFAPVEKPEVAVAVIVEHGEHGGSAAAPIAGRVLRSYFETRGVIKKIQKKEDESTEEDENEESDGPASAEPGEAGD